MNLKSLKETIARIAQGTAKAFAKKSRPHSSGQGAKEGLLGKLGGAIKSGAKKLTGGGDKNTPIDAEIIGDETRKRSRSFLQQAFSYVTGDRTKDGGGEPSDLDRDESQTAGTATPSSALPTSASPSGQASDKPSGQQPHGKSKKPSFVGKLFNYYTTSRGDRDDPGGQAGDKPSGRQPHGEGSGDRSQSDNPHGKAKPRPKGTESPLGSFLNVLGHKNKYYQMAKKTGIMDRALDYVNGERPASSSSDSDDAGGSQSGEQPTGKAARRKGGKSRRGKGRGPSSGGAGGGGVNDPPRIDTPDDDGDPEDIAKQKQRRENVEEEDKNRKELVKGITKTSAALGILAGIIAGSVTVFRKFNNWTLTLIENQKQYAHLSGGIAAAMGQLEVARIQQGIKHGAATAKSTKYLTESQARKEDEFQEYKSAWTKFKNYMGGFFNNALSSLSELVSSTSLIAQLIREYGSGGETDAPAWYGFLSDLDKTVAAYGSPRNPSKVARDERDRGMTAEEWFRSGRPLP